MHAPYVQGALVSGRGPFRPETFCSAPSEGVGVEIPRGHSPRNTIAWQGMCLPPPYLYPYF